jgi:vanillate O-demethylase ferredoxin subunit
VARKVVEAEDICSFELVSLDGRTLPAFSAGSHIDVHISPTLTRQYSLCNDAAECHRYLIGVLKAQNSRGGSHSMHESLSEGDILEISTPKNHFELACGAKRSKLFAGGIGITPILCMAERLHVMGADFRMHYATRRVERAAFRKRIQKGPFASRASFYFDSDPGSPSLNFAAAVGAPEEGLHLYVCGPKGFMDAVLGAARELGWLETNLHYEFFAAEISKSEDDQAFQIKLASSGRMVTVPKQESVCEALRKVGVEIPTSCEQGICGTCVTRVLEGEPDHRDMYFTSEEHRANDQFTPCCSRSNSPLLILDL